MIPFIKPDIGPAEIEAVIQVMQSGHIVQGEQVTELEERFIKHTETGYAVAVNSGTAALHIALYAIGIQPGDEVITTPFSFVATANAIGMVGAIPRFVDIDPQTFNLDPTVIESAVTKTT